jgi:hypothetical protein
MKFLLRNVFVVLIVSGFILMLGLASCEKEDTADFVRVAEVASQHLSADLDINHIFSILHKAAYDTALINNDTTIIDSALVTRAFDTVSRETVYTFNYAENTVSPDFKEKSGSFEATLDMDFTTAGATFEVLISDFMINDRTLQGSVYYTKIGENNYNLESSVIFSGENQPMITYNGNKNIVWTAGFENPIDFEEQKFTLSGEAISIFVDPYAENIREAEIISETDGSWDISFGCHKLVKQGYLFIDEILSETTETITGEFQDADIDGCGDKIMLKNQANFGYPFYF